MARTAAQARPGDLVHPPGARAVPFPAPFARVLELALGPGERVRLVEPFRGDGEEAYRWAAEQRLEGVVGKRLTSRYVPGARSDDWLKVKTQQADEFVIGGYTEGQRRRASTF